ncbi:deoxyribose-phosphate aldolase [Peptoniphilus equinus]|uniref:Deoxyribose-phosphate aldolase n=1 Tax=Peptoniphilus equinus TaxID=3016343 RepID=A0ABY7QVW5_9FIRM|nr:deoxyribose-phosphate aldolase [Peptoniphilus equinus]WBW50348.1 deoxyribose-phosphate aldolase [Peptoniphilus equinus]
MTINRYIDHTLLKPEATKAQVQQLIDEAKAYHFASVCINPTWVAMAHEALKDTDVNVCTVIGFDLGATTSAAKAFEAKEAVANGADEVDMVLNVGRFLSGEEDAVRDDIKAVVDASGDAIVKVILETCLLTSEQIRRACELAEEAGADFVKTSTGFNRGGATVEDVKLMKASVTHLKVKASGGIRDLKTALAMIEAGADRLGCSAGVAIVKEGQAE